jgi:hypothetical protein
MGTKNIASEHVCKVNAIYDTPPIASLTPFEKTWGEFRFKYVSES